MTDTQTPQPVSLAELRALRADVVCLKSLTPTERTLMEAYPALLDIAEAARAMFETADRSSHDADYWFEGDRIEVLETALAKVRP